jgi:hypothetical protein
MAKLSRSQLSSIKKQVKNYKDNNSITSKPSKKKQIKKIKKQVKKSESIKTVSKKITWSINVGDLVEHKNTKCIVVDLIEPNEKTSLRSSSAIIVNGSGSKFVETKTLKKL